MRQVANEGNKLVAMYQKNQNQPNRLILKTGIETVEKLGKSSMNPGVFLSSLYLAYVYSGGDMTHLLENNAPLHPEKTCYMECMRHNLLAGGESSPRAMIIGAILGAEGGMAVIPKWWCKKFENYSEIDQLVDGLISKSLLVVE